MPRRDIVVIGASAGGVPALLELARELPADIPAAPFVAVHGSPDAPSLLPALLSHAGNMPASFAINGEPIKLGRIYVAPKDRHLLVTDGKLEVTRGPAAGADTGLHRGRPPASFSPHAQDP